jgi:hypothetical protein
MAILILTFKLTRQRQFQNLILIVKLKRMPLPVGAVASRAPYPVHNLGAVRSAVVYVHTCFLGTLRAMRASGARDFEKVHLLTPMLKIGAAREML